MCHQQQTSFAAVERHNGSQLQQQGRGDQQVVLQVRLSLAAVHNGMWLDSKQINK